MNKPISTKTALQIFTSDSEQFLAHFWEFFSLVAFGDIQLSQKLYDHLGTVEMPPWQSPLVEIGRAKLLSISGKLFKSHKSFQTITGNVYSYDHFPSNRIENEILAFLNYEKTVLSSKIEDPITSKLYLHSGKKLTAIKNFLMAFDLQHEIFMAKEKPADLASLENAIHNIEEAGVPALACMGWRSAGVNARNSDNISMADIYFNDAAEIAEQHNLKQLTNQIAISKAILQSKVDNSNQARIILSTISPDCALDSILPSKYEILALIESREGNIDKSIEYVQKALEINLQLDNVALLPAECMWLGETYEKQLNDLDQAENYYKMGYDHSIRYAEHGISLTGDRKQVVDAYVNFLARDGKTGASSGNADSANPLEFATGRPWKEIKDIFQHQLILHHSQITRNSKSMAKKLAIPATTLYSLQDRLKNRGYELTSKGAESPSHKHELSGFIQKHTDLSWQEINKIFEREIMHYLYEKYGYNKHRMASVLKVSYPSIIKMTRQLTQIDEHLLPN